jgi:hypothetical protein
MTSEADDAMTSGATSAGYVAVGVVSAARDVASGALGRTARLVRASPVAAAAAGAVRVIGTSPLGPRLVVIVDGLGDRGRSETAAMVAQARGLVDSVTDSVARSDTAVRVVDEVVERVLWPIIDEVLPAVLERLAADPEQVQALVFSQSAGIIDDVTVAVRARAAHADDRAASFVDHVLRRKKATSAAAAHPPPVPLQ